MYHLGVRFSNITIWEHKKTYVFKSQVRYAFLKKCVTLNDKLQFYHMLNCVFENNVFTSHLLKSHVLKSQT
jgi:hypothetical protein